MPTGQNYQKHIESAIQNVLSKVKTPGRALPGEDRPIKPQATPVLPSAVRPAPRKATTDALSQAPAAPPLIPEPVILTEPVDIPTEPESPIYLEAEDLFTPLLEEDLNPPEEELPLLEDSYEAPYNLFEEFVETELNILLSRYLDLCRCSQCRADIVALALHQLPAYYVTGTRGTLTAKSVIWTRYMQQVMDAVTKGIHIVYKRPRPSCRKIKQVLWLKPEIEQVYALPAEILSETSKPGQELFGDIHQDDIEIKFSDEVSELIMTLEQSSELDRAELLPVFSPVVQRSYQQFVPEPTSEQATEAAAPDELQLLDIDNWDS
jgi:competence protein ComFB